MNVHRYICTTLGTSLVVSNFNKNVLLSIFSIIYKSDLQ